MARPPLNAAQLEAVRTLEGPLLVLAGAGSGKTRVITHRVAHLLERGTAPESIVALSFTNKAAGEMRERLAAMVGEKTAARLVLGTFHRLGASMLRADADAFGVPRRFAILDQGDTYGLVRSILREQGIHGTAGDRRFDVGGIVARIGRWKNELLGARAIAARARRGSEYDQIAADVFADYATRLEQLGAVDFDDLVVRVAVGLAADERLRARWRRKFDYVMVDEYQDTNLAQVRMLRQIVGPHDNLCVVGDDDQAIYGWRGADVANILEFESAFPGARVIKLELNYRSGAGILRAANALIRHNAGRHDKRLVVSRRADERVTSVLCRDGDHEAAWVGDRIRRAIVDEGAAPDEIAVLYRSARQARPIEARLQEHGIVHRVLGGQSLYDRKEVKDALAYLRVLVTPRDDLAVRRALDVPNRGIGAKSLAALATWAGAHGRPLLTAVHHAGEIEGLSSRATAALAGFSGQVREASARARVSGVAAALRGLIDSVGLREHARRENGNDEAMRRRWQDVEWLLESVARFEQRPSPRWVEYLTGASLEGREGEVAVAAAPAVTLATLHSAKGLEWSTVFLVGCEEDVIPHRRVASPRASDAVEGDLEEERRLFYVGITRARDRLFLTRAAVRSDRGREHAVTPSRFLLELPQDELTHCEPDRDERVDGARLDALADAFLAKYADVPSLPGAGARRGSGTPRSRG
jgi:DNA helicase-2/ATP-dependent DNA helicase PcrA